MIKELVPLRFVLILMIFFHHAANFAGGGSAGVTYFFVLSGFCMMLGYRDKVMENNFSYLGYLKKRMGKVFPLHWITLAVVVVLMLIAEHSIGGLRTLLANALLLQSWIPDMRVYFSYNDVSWYLSTALFATIMFPVLVSFFERIGKHDKWAIGVLLMVMYSVIAWRMPLDNRHAMLYIHPVARLVDFVVGMYLAYIWMVWRKNERLMLWIRNHGWLLDVGFVLAFVMFILIAVCANNDIRPIAGIYWLPIAVSLLCLVLGTGANTWLHRIMQNHMVGLLTRCSFSMMMWHSIIIESISTGGGEWRSLIVKLIASYVVSQISYCWIEKKIIR